MFLKSKKYLVFGVLLLILVTIVVLKIFFPTQATPVQPTLPPISLEAPQEAPTGVVYTFTENLPSLPNSAIIYKITSPPVVSLAEANQIAQSFGFNGEPKINTDIEQGDFYSWADQDKQSFSANKYLSIGGNPLNISFGLSSLTNLSTSSANLSNQEANAIAQKIFKEKIPLEKNIEFNNPSFSHSQTKGEFIKVSYNYKLNGFPLLGNAPSILPFSISLGPNGEIINLDYIKYPNSFEASGERTLLNTQQIKTSLSLQKGIIVQSLSDQDINTGTPPTYQINSVQIEKTSLAYYYPQVPSLEKEFLVQPIFVFEGKGVDQTSGKIVNLIIYLPATPGL